GIGERVVHPGPAAFAGQGADDRTRRKHHRVVRARELITQTLKTAGDQRAVIFASQANEGTPPEQAAALSRRAVVDVEATLKNEDGVQAVSQLLLAAHAEP